MTDKQYAVSTHSDHEADYPGHARFSISKSFAEEILRLSQLVRDNGLYKVELFATGHVEFLNCAPEDLEEDDAGDNQDADNADGSRPRVDCETLNVSNDDFWFSANIRNDSVSFSTDTQSLADLAKHFELPFAG